MFKPNRGSKLLPSLVLKRSRSRLSKAPPSARGISSTDPVPPLPSPTQAKARLQSASQSHISTAQDTTADEEVWALLEKFKDPESHYYLAPGQVGPSHEDDHSGSQAPPGRLDPQSSSSSTTYHDANTSSTSTSTPPLSSGPTTSSSGSNSHRPCTAEVNTSGEQGTLRRHASQQTVVNGPEVDLGTLLRQRGGSVSSRVEVGSGPAPSHSRKGSAVSLKARRPSISSSPPTTAQQPLLTTVTATNSTPGQGNASETLVSPGGADPVAVLSSNQVPFASTSTLPSAAPEDLAGSTITTATSYTTAPNTPGELSAASTTVSKDSQAREAAAKYFRENGYDSMGILEWPVAWGDCDMYQHANNVQYVRWFESARIKYGESLKHLLPEGMMDNMLKGKGNGIILKDVSIRYRLPVTYPDTLLIASKPHSINQERGSYCLAGAYFSLKMGKLVATGDSTIVMYDYDNLRKGVMPDIFRDVLMQREKINE